VLAGLAARNRILILFIEPAQNSRDSPP